MACGLFRHVDVCDVPSRNATVIMQWNEYRPFETKQRLSSTILVEAKDSFVPLRKWDAVDIYSLRAAREPLYPATQLDQVVLPFK